MAQRVAHRLTDKGLKEPGRVYDGQGLFLEITATGRALGATA